MDGTAQLMTAHKKPAYLTIAGRPISKLKKLSPQPNKKGVKCTKSKKTIACNITSLSCSLCDAHHHIICVMHQGHTIDEVDAASKSTLSTLDEAIESSELMQTADKDDIKILQWNADGVLKKWTELSDRLREQKVDIALIQETKLNSRRRTPQVNGYAPIRFDRPEGNGGGLLCLIQSDLPFTSQNEWNCVKGNVQTATFKARTAKRQWLTFTNICTPPNRETGGEETIVTSHIPTNRNCFLAGDLNDHSLSWDHTQPQDSRGDRIEEWIADCNLFSANKDEATRHNRATGITSSPDIFLAPITWLNRVSWQTGEDIGGSGHLPILITLQTKVKLIKPPARSQRWMANADLSLFAKKLEQKICTFYQNAKNQNAPFTAKSASSKKL